MEKWAYLINNIIVLAIITSFLNCCKANRAKIHSHALFETPPGAVKIGMNLYVDRTEITNFSYSEFVFWTARVDGRESLEYEFLYPDSSSWRKVVPKRISFFSYYNLLSYRDFPVVGINYEQAKKFCKWRSDRVMEFFLIKEGVLNYQPIKQTQPDSVFTIEKYFTGKYLNMIPNPDIQYYPDYQLPDTSVYSRLVLFADSLSAKDKFNDLKFRRGGSHPCKCSENKRAFITSEGLHSTRCRKCKKPLVVDLNGNALELTNIRGLGFGGSYSKSSGAESKTKFVRIDSTMVDVGFRNVCNWRKWQQR